MAEWLTNRLDEDRARALLVLGTNNLRLLVQRIEYNPNQDNLMRLCRHLPVWLQNRKPVYRLATRRLFQAQESQDVLQFLGSNAAPIVPALRQVADKCQYPSFRALDVLSWIPDEGIAAVIATANTPGHSMRLEAIRLLGKQTNCAPALVAVTNFLSHSDPTVRMAATNALTRTLPAYEPRYGRSPDEFGVRPNEKRQR